MQQNIGEKSIFCMCAAYLLGCPVRGVVLDAVEALKIGVAGQVQDKASIFILSYPYLGYFLIISLHFPL